VAANICRFFGEGHAANPSAPGGPGLDLDYDFDYFLFRGEFLGYGDRFIRSRSGAPARDFESVRRKNGLALIFVKSCHG
jgi:hypothetical protein